MEILLFLLTCCNLDSLVFYPSFYFFFKLLLLILISPQSLGEASEQKVAWVLGCWLESTYSSSLQLVQPCSEPELYYNWNSHRHLALASCIFQTLTFPLWSALAYIWENIWAKQGLKFSVCLFTGTILTVFVFIFH